MKLRSCTDSRRPFYRVFLFWRAQAQRRHRITRSPGHSSLLRLIAVGVNHSSASLDLRERLSMAAGGGGGWSGPAGVGPAGDDVQQDRLRSVLAELRSRAEEGFVLTTCGRTELYAFARLAVDPIELLADVLGGGGTAGASAGLDASELRDACYVHVREAATRHALRVASGLDSLVLGEDQIQAQMKKALAAARAAGALGPITERLGAAALACGKRVRTHTGLGRHAVSLESLAVRAALEVGDLAAREVLVIGAGDSASIVLRQLRSAGAGRVTVVSRTAARARRLAEAHGVRSWSADSAAGLAEALVHADVVFCCTSAPHPVVTPELLAPRQRARGAAPLLCIDLGMPRDVDPAVTRLGARVVALDALDAMAREHRATRREHVPEAEAIVEREAARFTDWLRARAAAADVSESSRRADEIVRSELARILTRLEGATLRDKELVAEMAHRIARKLAHDSITSLKQSAGDDSVPFLEKTIS